MHTRDRRTEDRCGSNCLFEGLLFHLYSIHGLQENDCQQHEAIDGETQEIYQKAGNNGGVGDPSLSLLRSLFLRLCSKALGQHRVKVVVLVPIIEIVELLLGFGLGIGSNLEFEAMRKM